MRLLINQIVAQQAIKTFKTFAMERDAQVTSTILHSTAPHGTKFPHKTLGGCSHGCFPRVRTCMALIVVTLG
jgi:hypothetical protein